MIRDHETPFVLSVAPAQAGAESKHERPRDFQVAIALALAIAAVFGRALGHEFLNWDDDLYVLSNPDIQAVTLGNLKAVVSKFYVGNYAPVHMLSYLAEHAVWGPRPAGFILTNLTLHAAAAALLLALLRRLGASAAAASLGSFVFAIHPVQVETVVWISQQKTLLAMVFSLATLHLHVRATEGDRPRWRGITLANGAFLLALLSKSVAVVVPLVALLLDIARGRRLRPAVLVDKLPFALTAAGAGALALVSHASAAGGGIAPAWPGGSPLATALTMVTVVRDYLKSLVFPAGLSVLYEPVKRTSLDGAVLGSAIVIVAAAALPLAFPRERRRAAAAWVAIFFVGIVPVPQIVPLVTLRNDRYLYFPMLGLAGLVALGVDAARGAARRPAIAAGVAVAAALGVAAAVRTGVWHDTLSLFEDAVSKQPASAQAWFEYARELQDRGRRPESIAAYRRCDDLDPTRANVPYNLARLLGDGGDLPGAVELYVTAIARNPGHISARYNLALALVQLGRFREAQDWITDLLRLSPGARDALLLRGHARYGMGDWAAAAEAYAAARATAPKDTAAVNYEALARERAGDAAGAGRLMADAVAAGADRGRLLFERADLEAVVGHPEAALSWLDAALAAGFRDRAALSDPQSVRSLPGCAAVLQPYGL